MVEEKKTRDSLKKVKLNKLEDPYPKKYMTADAGKITFMRHIRNKINGFYLDVLAAVKAIIREVM